MFEIWVQSLGGKIPWRREWLPTLVFWPEEFNGLYNPWGRKELELSDFHFQTYGKSYKEVVYTIIKEK